MAHPRVRCIIMDPSERFLLGKNRVNKFNLPGGKIKKNEHPVDALLREVKEETGIIHFSKLNYLWDQDDNKVFILQVNKGNKPTGQNDPDKEFYSFGWFTEPSLPKNLDKFAKNILHRYFTQSDKLPGGLADDKTPEDFDPLALEEGLKVELEHTTDKELAREIAMDHLTEDPEYYIKLRKVEGSGNTERSLQMKRIYETIDELLLRYIPEEKSRPSAEIIYDVDYLGKTTWKTMGGKHYTHITVNHKIVDNPDLLRQVLAHEIVHHHLYQKYGKEVAKHGEHFEMIADRINSKEGKHFVTEFANNTNFKEGNAD